MNPQTEDPAPLDHRADRLARHPQARIAERKLQQLRVSLEESLQSTRTAGFERWALCHQALPELDFDAIDTASTFLERRLRVPFVVSSPSGSAHAVGEGNRRLALVAQTMGLALGIGSLRAGLTHRDLRPRYQVRSVAPDVLLLANLPAAVLNSGSGPAQCAEAVEMLEADALILSLNPLQEALQPAGDHDFRGLLDKIAGLCRTLGKPVIVKEVGCGISGAVAGRLAAAGVAALDVAGAGGRSVARVEAFRRERAEDVELALAFSEWGIPTAESLRQAHAAAPTTPLIASGGVRNGLDAAKAVALGADLVGFARAVPEAASEGEQPMRRLLEGYAWQLRVAMFCVGAADLQQLKAAPLIEQR